MEKQGYRYEFSHFQLDLEKRLLFREGGEAVSLTPKALDVLIILIHKQGELVRYDDLKRLVWKESKFVEDKTLTQTIYTLRVSLGDSSTEQKFIENVPKRGYRFVGNAVLIGDDGKERRKAFNEEKEEGKIPLVSPQQITHPKLLYAIGAVSLLGVLIICIGIGIYLSNSFGLFNQSANTSGQTNSNSYPLAKTPSEKIEVRSPSDERKVKEVIKKSQTYESLKIYVTPNNFDESKIKEYWLSENSGGKEIKALKTSLLRLRTKGLHYGKESRLERFEFRYVRIYSPRDYAEAGTIERWYLPLYRMDRTKVTDRNDYLGPYNVDYVLRKVGGKWKIEETSTPRYKEKK